MRGRDIIRTFSGLQVLLLEWVPAAALPDKLSRYLLGGEPGVGE